MGKKNQIKKYSWPVFPFLFFLCHLALYPAEDELVELALAVTDKNGNYVEDLARDDFEVYEDGKKQKIVEFSVGEVFNRKFIVRHQNGKITWKPRNLFVIFDQSATDPSSLQRIKEPLKKFLGENFGREDNLYFFTDRAAFAWQGQKLIHFGQKTSTLKVDEFKNEFFSEIISGLTQEAVETIFSPEKYTGFPETPDKGWNPRNKPEEYLSQFEVDYKRFTVLNFIERLKAIARAAEKIEGEKTALLISEVPQQNLDPLMKSETTTVSSYIGGGKFRGRVVDEGKTFMSGSAYPSSLGEWLSHSRTAVYSVLLGSGKLSALQLENTDVIRNTIWEKEPPSSPSLPEMNFEARNSYPNIIRSLSKETGGVALTNVKDLGDCLSQIGRAVKKSYFVSYSSSDPEKDGKFRRIQVKIKKSGLRIRHRKGYFAFDREKEEVQELEKALEKKATSQKLMIFMRTMIIPLENSRPYLLLKIEPTGLAVNDMTWVEDEQVKSRLTAQMHLLVQLKDEAGNVKESLSKKFDFEIKQQQLFLRPAVYFGQELSAGKYRVKISLKDRRSGEITTQEEEVRTKNLWPWDEEEKDDVRHFLFLKRDSLVRELNQVKEVFVYNGEKLFPRLDEEFKTEENLEFYFEVNGDGEKGIDFYFQTSAEDNQPFKTYQMSGFLKDKANPFLISLPLKEYFPGRYTLQMTAIRRGSQEYSIVRKSFQVIL